MSRIKYFETITNSRGDSLANYRVQVVDSTGAIVEIYRDEAGTRFQDAAGNVVNFTLAGPAGKAEFWWEPASGQILQVLDAAGNLVDSTDGFANKYVLTNLPGNIATAAVDGLDDSLAAKVATAELASDGGAALVVDKLNATGAVALTQQQINAENVTAARFNADATGSVSALVPIRNLVKAVRKSLSDGSRAFAGEARIGGGRFLIDGDLNLAADGPVTGLTLVGDNAGSTEFVFTNPTARITAAGSSNLTFRNITFRSIDPVVDADIYTPGAPYGIALGQSAFYLAHSFGTDATTLRSWKWQSCNFAGLLNCFDVSGISMCSEMFFENCQFSQCYRLMNNDNNQAVNWNFVNCNWENEGLDLTGTTGLTKSGAAMFRLKKGTFVKWTGGSIISYGPLVRFLLPTSAAFEGNSHKLTFDGVRIERENDGGTCTPLFERIEDGTYVNAGNAPSVVLVNSSVIYRDGIPSTVDILKLWDNLKLVIGNCEFEAGRAKGVYSAVTGANTGELTVTRTSGLSYYEDTANRVSDHIAHSVTIEPDTRGSTPGTIFQQRSRALGAPVSLPVYEISVGSDTGNVPQAGTIEQLPPLNNHTVIRTIYIRKALLTGNPLTMALRGRTTSTVYFTVTAAPGDRTVETQVNAEIGFQITEPLDLVFSSSGSAEVMKGEAGISCK